MTEVSDRTAMTDAVAAACEALGVCARTSEACAATMTDLGGMAAEIAAAHDCSDLCAVADRVLARRGAGVDAHDAVASAVVDGALVACEASARACGAHADHHDHCARHARAAEAAATALRALRPA